MQVKDPDCHRPHGVAVRAQHAARHPLLGPRSGRLEPSPADGSGRTSRKSCCGAVRRVRNDAARHGDPGGRRGALATVPATRRPDRAGAPATVRRLVPAEGQGRSGRGAAGDGRPGGARRRPGSPAAIGRSLTTVSYTVATGPKTVQYFSARMTGGEFAPNREVDQLEWVPVARAAERLTLRVRPRGGDDVRTGARRAVRGGPGAARAGGSAGGLSRRRPAATVGRQGKSAGSGARAGVARVRALAGAQRAVHPLRGHGRPARRVPRPQGRHRADCWARTPTGTTPPAPGNFWFSWPARSPTEARSSRAARAA